MKYDDPDNVKAVEFDRRDWVRVMAAATNGMKQLTNAEEVERLDELLDEIRDQAEITVVELLELEMEFRAR